VDLKRGRTILKNGGEMNNEGFVVTGEQQIGAKQNDEEAAIEEPASEDVTAGPAEMPLSTAEETLFLSKMLWNIPTIIFSDMAALPEEDIKSWNEQLFLYCKRKNLNIYDYLFDEFGLVIATVTLGSKTYKNYKTMNQGKQAEKEEVKHGDLDYQHYKDVEQAAVEKSNVEKSNVEQSNVDKSNVEQSNIEKLEKEIEKEVKEQNEE